MRILLFGATGMIGSRIAAEAGERGHEVTGATRSGKDGTLAADASDADTVARLAAGHDAVVLAVAPPRGGVEASESLLEVGRGVLDGVRRAGVRRLVVVGGAGILEVSPVYGSSTPPGSPRTSCRRFARRWRCSSLSGTTPTTWNGPTSPRPRWSSRASARARTGQAITNCSATARATATSAPRTTPSLSSTSCSGASSPAASSTSRTDRLTQTEKLARHRHVWCGLPTKYQRSTT